MFDIGFWELIFIAVVALLVLGPDKMPSALRSVGRFVRSAKQMANGVKAELNHELRVHELHQQLKQAEEKGMKHLNDAEQAAVGELQDAAKEVNQPYQSLKEEVTQPLSDTESANPTQSPAKPKTTKDE